MVRITVVIPLIISMFVLPGISWSSDIDRARYIAKSGEYYNCSVMQWFSGYPSTLWVAFNGNQIAFFDNSRLRDIKKVFHIIDVTSKSYTDYTINGILRHEDQSTSKVVLEGKISGITLKIKTAGKTKKFNFRCYDDIFNWFDRR